MKILILTDIHYDNRRPNRKGKMKILSYSAKQELEYMSKKFNEDSYDYIFQLGDIISTSENKEKDIKNLETILPVLRNLQPQPINTVGNHEPVMFNRSELISLYDRSKINSDFYGIIEEDSHNIMWLSPSLSKEDSHWGSIPDEEIEWFKNNVNTSKPLVLFSHYPVLKQNTQALHYFGEHQKASVYLNSKEILPYLHQCPYVIAVNGHLHMDSYIREKNIHGITASPFSQNYFSRSDDSDHPRVYSTISIDKRGMRFSSYTNGALFVNKEISFS